MCFGSLVALAVSLGAPPPQVPAGIPTHVQDQIRWAVGSAEVGALVTVLESTNKASVAVRVDEPVMGELTKGELLQVARAKFAAQDLTPGTVLLVFLNKPGKAALLYSSSGRYELDIDGNIREIARADFLAATRSEASAKAKKAEGRHVAALKAPSEPAQVPGS